MFRGESSPLCCLLQKTMKRKILRITLYLSILIGLCLVLYPTISNLINAVTNDSIITDYNKNANSYSNERLNQIYNGAEEYNKAVADKYAYGNRKNNLDVLNSYNNILNFGDGLMGYIEIPEINVSLPIYHGGDEDVLKKGAVHLEKTSLPVGGINTHSVISAHSGYPTQKFFDDIDKLNPGSVIYIHTLNTKIVYKVINSEVVEPNDSSKLTVIEGKDVLTLVTCYPYGINSHRLLVHAERIDNTDTTASNDEISSIEQSYGIPVILLPVLSLILAVVAFLAVKNIRHKKRKKADGGEDI